MSTKVTRLIVEAQGQLQSETVTMPDDTQCVLIGRTPNAATLLEKSKSESNANANSNANSSSSNLPSSREVREHTIPSPNVSGNHAVAWLDAGALHLRDLDSRNGTWVRLPPGEALRLPAEIDIEVRLSSTLSAGSTDGQPEVPRYLDQTDFGTTIAHAVRTWLSRHDIPARAWAAPQKTITEAPAGVTSIPLQNGDVLFIQVERTADIAFHDRMTQISRYVHAQNALYSAEDSTRSDGMILASSALRQVHRRVVEVAMQGLPSLILLGPSGTGKERLAHAYHRHLGRTGPLVAINCATLSRDRIIADLFGAEAGAYTDAKRSVMGAVERADGGTLFLDELGELPLDVQPMLLRFLETGEYQRLGAAGRQRFADVRVVAATNRDLRQMVRTGTFREDLFFRTALEIVDVPPLRERFADVEAYLRARMLGETSTHDALQPAALELLRAYRWPGNFREVMNFVRRLPSPARREQFDVAIVRRALEAGSLAPVSDRPSLLTSANDQQQEVVGVSGGGGVESWIDWLCASAHAFTDSMDQDAPTTWGDMSVFIEQFLKPWALAHLGRAGNARGMDDISVGQIAERVKADRGTVVKQLRRYFESLK